MKNKKRYSILIATILSIFIATTMLAQGQYLPLVLVGYSPYIPPTLTPTPTRTPIPSPTFTPSPIPHAKLSIIYIKASGRDEYVTIRNTGSASQNMSGWWLQSYDNDGCTPLSNQRYWFPYGYILAPGASVRVHSGPDARDNPPGHLRWTGKYIWNNAGDIGDLRNSAGQLVDRYTYGTCS